MRIHNPYLNANARSLRKSMTKEERHLWYEFLNSLPVRFLRQKVVEKYIVDFYCAEKRLIIELDGSQHYENNEHIEADKQRDEFLRSKGYMVLRYTNLQINFEFNNICEDIYKNLNL